MNVPNQDPVSSLVIEHDSIHHQEDYFGYFGIPGGDFYISARNTLLRACSFFLARDSDYWRAVIETLYSSDNALGSSVSRPFYLDEDPDEVAQFLFLPYNPRFNLFDKTPNEWGAIFRLANQWGAPGIRDFAISKIQSTSMDMVDKVRVYLKYNAPRELYYPLMETLAYHDELPEDLLPIFVGETSMEDIPEGFDVPQVPPPSLNESNVLPIPPAESTVSEDNTCLTQISENEDDSPSSISSAPDISSKEQDVINTLGENGKSEDVPEEEGVAKDFRSSRDNFNDRWVIVDGNQKEDPSLSHPSVRRPLMLHDFIIPYCLFVSIISAFIA
ncbi:hypothetical protein Agabi119p4_2184 [Agaricus bisporus var. burnettii]|uniref:BTB domain-containing protein n=1 Tax=Agaricus bisporus var. burnettii TaxID=192524 RepID=A0A8H7KK09_AGABI|nr:hypothetical protein Agabi119p4_2184 [Agaricus bisporus var. burnettii]